MGGGGRGEAEGGGRRKKTAGGECGGVRGESGEMGMEACVWRGGGV